MRFTSGCILALVFAGCASTPDPLPDPPEDPGIPDTLAGLPQAVVAERALFDLDSGDAERVRRARCVLIALPEGRAVEALRDRVKAGPAGSAARLEALALLAERGDALDEAAAEEVVTLCLREMARPEPSRRAHMLFLDRLRGMGEAARPYLREASRPGGPDAAEATEALRVLFGEGADHRLREGVP